MTIVKLYSDEFPSDVWELITSIVDVPVDSDGVALTVCRAVPIDENGDLMDDTVPVSDTTEADN